MSTQCHFLTLELDLTGTLALIGNLQLALRHPENTGPTSKITRNLVGTLAKIVQEKRPDLDARIFEEWKKEGYLWPSVFGMGD